MSVDTSRHISLFDPDNFAERRVDIIGCGATGSRIAIGLAKLGIENLHLWDFDVVEEHNIANQAYGIVDIGQLKVDALAEEIEYFTGIEPEVHNVAVDGTQPLGDVVFLLTDTMASRKQIWDGAIKFKPAIQVMFETRMGVDVGRLYAVKPWDLDHVKRWESSLCSDDEAEVSSCGTRITVGGTAEVISGLAQWAFMQWFAHSQDAAASHPSFETIFQVRPLNALVVE